MLFEDAVYLIFNILVVWKATINLLKQICPTMWIYNVSELNSVVW